MLGKISSGVIYSRPNVYTVDLMTNNVEHDFKYVQHLAQKLRCVDVRKIRYRAKLTEITIYFINKYAAEKFAHLIKKCHLYDKEFKIKMM